MTTRITGIVDQVKLTNSVPAEVSMDHIISCSCSIDNQSKPAGCIGQGSAYQYHQDGMVLVSGSIETEIVSLKILQLMGTYSAGWSVTLDDTLPAFTLAMNETATELLTLTGVKFGKVSLDFKEGEAIKATFDYQALTHASTTATVTYTKPSSAALMWTSAKAKFGSTYVGAVSSGNITYDRSIESKRGIENQSDRNPSQIVEKMKNFTFNLTIDITDDVAWDLVDTRTATTLTLELPSTGGSMVLSGVLVKDIKFDKKNDGEVRTVIVNGTALSAAITGS
jgi:hypothetical protein